MRSPEAFTKGAFAVTTAVFKSLSLINNASLPKSTCFSSAKTKSRLQNPLPKAAASSVYWPACVQVSLKMPCASATPVAIECLCFPA